MGVHVAVERAPLDCRGLELLIGHKRSMRLSDGCASLPSERTCGLLENHPWETAWPIPQSRFQLGPIQLTIYWRSRFGLHLNRR